MNEFPLQRCNELELTDSGVYRSASRAIGYSEGSRAEEYLRRVFASASDLSSNSADLDQAIRDWPSEYHLSSERANILRCLDLKGIDKGLELGCGCGAITRYLGEIGLRLDAVEGETSRAELAKMRCRDLDNVSIVQANFNELSLPEKSYDAAFLIGVIEYAALFSPGHNDDRIAATDILARIRSTLKNDGILVLALENRMGLKYLMGAGEDHLGKPFVGIYDYPGGPGVSSYSRKEWERLFRDSGWNHFSFLYPFPDYKLPRVILGDGFIRNDPFSHSLLYRMDSRDYLSQWHPDAHEFLAWRGIHRAGLLPELSNSFLIVAANSAERLTRCTDLDFVHFSSRGRRPALRTMTVKRTRAETISKKRLSSENIAPGSLEQLLPASTYQQGELLSTCWLENLFADDHLASLSHSLRKYHAFLKESFANSPEPGELIDLLPSNIIVDARDGTWKTFDLEWAVADRVDSDFVFFRAILWFGDHNRRALARVHGPLCLTTLHDFVIFCFQEIGLDFSMRRNAFIRQEEALHREVVAPGAPGLDVLALLDAPLPRRKCTVDNHLDVEPEKKAVEQAPPELPGRTKIEKMLPLAKKGFKVLQSRLFSRHCRIIRRSGMFDPAYYVSMDAALQDPTVEPLLHYVRTGFREGRDPGPLFSIKFYRKQYPDLGDEVDPLLHYLETGAREGACPHPLLKDWKIIPAAQPGRVNLFPADAEKREQKQAAAYFNEQFYLNRYPDVAASKQTPLLHYLIHGGRERRQPGPFFDPEWYLDRTPEGEAGTADLLQHYLKAGVRQGRTPVPVFDPEFYRSSSDVGNDPDEDLFGHYLENGIQRDQRPCSWFDPAFYRKRCPDLSPYQWPLDHYLYQGVHEGIYVNSEVAGLPRKPLISILVPVYNVKAAYLNCCIRSVLFQSYPHWQLCLVDDGSTEPHVRTILRQWAGRDPRIRVKFLEDNQGIARASNIAAGLATGEFLAFLDNDDELHPESLFELVTSFVRTGADLFYTDEDLIGDDGSPFSFFHKPDFNSELLCCHNYITHLVSCRRQLFDRVGGFSDAMSGAQDYDLFLKLSEQAERIIHIPRVLYHWRAAEDSTSINHSRKEYADNAGRMALQEAMARRDIRAEVMPGQWKFYYRVKRVTMSCPKISVIVPDPGDQEYKRRLVKLTGSTRYPEIEFVIVGKNRKIDKEVLKAVRTQAECEIFTVGCGRNTSPAGLFNNAVSNCRGEYIVFINSWVRPEVQDWIEALLEYGQDNRYGVVGGRIFPAGEREFISTLPDLDNDSPLYYARFLQECSRHLNGLQCSQQVISVSWNLALVAKNRFEEFRGFDEDNMGLLFADSDLCLRMRERGLDHIYTPHAAALWQVPEEKIDGNQAVPLTDELKIFQKQWREVLTVGDPYYNLNIVRDEIGLEQFRQWYIGNKLNHS